MTNHQSSKRPLILFDGVCALCNASVGWIVARDRGLDHQGRVGRFDFASLQSTAAKHALAAAGATTHAETSLESVILVDEGRVLVRSDAAIAIARRLSFPWPVIARVACLVPRGLRDALYAWVARNRYRWFGRRDACTAPTPALRSRFLDADEWPDRAVPTTPVAPPRES